MKKGVWAGERLGLGILVHLYGYLLLLCALDFIS